MLTLDGSFGEGGGQIVRTALTLSMISGTPFRIERVRAGRKKPGLLRQHLTCVKASERIASARVTGAELGATNFTFEPGAINAGEYEFAIGSAPQPRGGRKPQQDRKSQRRSDACQPWISFAPTSSASNPANRLRLNRVTSQKSAQVVTQMFGGLIAVPRFLF